VAGSRNPAERKMDSPKLNEFPACPGCFRLKNPGAPCPLGARGGGSDGRGQRVPRRLIVSQGSAALLPPALGFAAGFALAGLLFPLSGGDLRAAAGAALMFLCAFGVYLFRRPAPAELP
jgi:hypothetical protein